MVATRFAVAAHILLLLAAEPGMELTTSQRLARSVNANPVVVRRINGALARAGLIRVRRGPGGAELARPPGRITLGDVWAAVNDRRRPLLPLHLSPEPGSPGGQRVAVVLGGAFADAEAALTSALARTTIEQLARGLRDGAEADGA